MLDLRLSYFMCADDSDEVGGWVGAASVLNGNADVPRRAQGEQRFDVDQMGEKLD